MKKGAEIMLSPDPPRLPWWVPKVRRRWRRRRLARWERERAELLAAAATWNRSLHPGCFVWFVWDDESIVSTRPAEWTGTGGQVLAVENDVATIEWTRTHLPSHKEVDREREIVHRSVSEIEASAAKGHGIKYRPGSLAVGGGWSIHRRPPFPGQERCAKADAKIARLKRRLKLP